MFFPHFVGDACSRMSFRAENLTAVIDSDQIGPRWSGASVVLSEGIVEDVMTTLKIVTAAAGLLVGGTSLAMAQYGGWYPGYGYGYGYDYAAPAYGYAATAPLYNYAAPAYGYGAAAPATSGTTVVIVTPAPAYTAPPVVSGYYNYAPGYWGGGYGRAGYWGGYGYGWR